MFVKGSLIAQARRLFKPVGFPMGESRKPRYLAVLWKCVEKASSTHSWRQNPAVLHFHLTFQAQDGERRKEAGLFCTVTK